MKGGVIYIEKTNVIIRNCLFKLNQAEKGGVIYFEGKSFPKNLSNIN